MRSENNAKLKRNTTSHNNDNDNDHDNDTNNERRLIDYLTQVSFSVTSQRT